jgi:hypothetical protein
MFNTTEMPLKKKVNGNLGNFGGVIATTELVSGIFLVGPKSMPNVSQSIETTL